MDAEAFEQATAAARHSLDPPAHGDALEPYAKELLPQGHYEEWAEGRHGESTASVGQHRDVT